MDITMYHNPRCSKSRETLELLRRHGVEPRIVLYLETPPDRAELETLLAALGKTPRELARRGEAAWQDIGLEHADDARVLAALLEHPVLIERPIVVCGGRAVIGRPPQAVLALLDGASA